MEITKKKEGNATVVSIIGRMDAVSSPEFENKIEGLIAEGENNLIIDLGKLDYISSGGLRSILAAAKKLKAKEGQLLLASLNEIVKEVFEISGFSFIIPIYESVDTALLQI
jgi:anti-sigma B factor antagonist/stage II sporulation protein AA (anti-sigma F factor antagonist)